ncbi:MAG TPA: adenylate/guanylate cyclase domain-containing protein [Nocardioides sp.]|nr:adenylate/guanylate cyclase domain-containing protein [Nocardioides sp.]
MDDRLPSGRVTFAFTDVVGSTRAFAEHGERYVDALRRLHAMQAEVVTEHGGTVLKTDGDGALLVFADAASALGALRALQAAAEAGPPSPGLPHLRLRAGAHCGEAAAVDGDYVSFAVHVAARVGATAGAGQVIVTGDVLEGLDAPGDVVRLGSYRLKDIDGGTTLWRVAGDDSPPRATPMRLTNVAPARTSFVGRDVELTWLRKRLAEPCLVTLVGPGGIGKTRLVSELAEHHWSDYEGGVWLVELGPLREEAAVLSAVAAVLGLRGTAEVTRVVSEICQRGEIVLVLDNCEHLVDAAATLAADLLAGCPRLRLVATSREPLSLPDEQVRRVQPLTSAHHDGSDGAAVELFLTRVAAAGGDAGGFDAGTRRRVCSLLDGLPLAIELAAARAPDLPVPALLDALEHQSLELGRRGGAARQRSLEAVVTWSLDLLDPLERDAAAVLSVFPNGFRPDAAAHVLSEALGPPAGSLAAGLARRSLLDVDGDRYRMLETVRWVTHRLLAADAGLADRAHQALYGWSRHRAVEIFSPRTVLDDVLDGDLARAMQEALEWALPRGLPDCDTMLWLCARYSEYRFADPRLVHLCRLALDVSPVGTPAAAAAAAVAARRLGGGVATKERRATALTATEAQRLLERAREGTPAEHWRAAVSIAFAFASSDSELATVTAGEALAVVDANPELAVWRVLTLNTVATTLDMANRLTEAEATYAEALAQARDDDLPNERDVVASNLAELLLEMDRPGDALAALAEPPSSTPTNYAVWLALRAEAELGCGHRDRAVTLAREAASRLRTVTTGDTSYAASLERLEALGIS